MSKKISELTAKTVYNDTDLVLISTDNGATFTSEKTTIADLRNALIGVQPKRYKALITMTGDINNGIEQYYAPLVIGRHYEIKEYQTGDDFTNVGAEVNILGATFVATGTTPTNWSNASQLIWYDIDTEESIIEDTTDGVTWSFEYPKLVATIAGTNENTKFFVNAPFNNYDAQAIFGKEMIIDFINSNSRITFFVEDQEAVLYLIQNQPIEIEVYE